MKFSPLIAPSLVVLAIIYNQTFAGASEDMNSNTANAGKSEHIQQVTRTCYQAWEEMDWTFGNNQMLAREHVAFSKGIERICQARAELFFEGYEISPFIQPGSQQQVFPIVFRASVDEIKSHFHLNLPKLRLI